MICYVSSSSVVNKKGEIPITIIETRSVKNGYLYVFYTTDKSVTLFLVHNDDMPEYKVFCVYVNNKQTYSRVIKIE